MGTHTMLGEGRIRVLIADEHSLFRESLRALLESQGDLLVVAEASDGLQAVDAAERFRPDVVLIEAESPNCDGIRATAMMSARGAAITMSLLVRAIKTPRRSVGPPS